MPRAQYSVENTPCLTEVACSPKKNFENLLRKVKQTLEEKNILINLLSLLSTGQEARVSLIFHME